MKNHKTNGGPGLNNVQAESYDRWEKAKKMANSEAVKK